MNRVAKGLIAAAKKLRTELDTLQFDAPVSVVYNPLHYAWSAHEKYLSLYATSPCRTLLLGMNPGPWGMAQTGVPFGEIAAVRDYLKISTKINKPVVEHPKRPIDGFHCSRSEVSGKRLWGLFSSIYNDPRAFFAEHFVANYCPLVFMDQGARNVTPDKLPIRESQCIDQFCDQHLSTLMHWIQPKFAIGVGAYAQSCLSRVCSSDPAFASIKVSKILHPSPASPAANRDWAGQATQQLRTAGVWNEIKT